MICSEERKGEEDGNDSCKSADGALSAAGHGADYRGGFSTGLRPAGRGGTLTAVALLLVIIAVLAVLISWLLRSAAKGDMGKSKLFLRQKDELCDQQQDMQVFVGHEGKTLSVLRPSGIGDFDGMRLNVVTEGEFIENGTPIRIVRVEGGKIVVKAM